MRKRLRGKCNDLRILRGKQSAKLRSVIAGTTLEYIGQLFFEPPAAQFLIYLKMSATCFSQAFENPDWEGGSRPALPQKLNYLEPAPV